MVGGGDRNTRTATSLKVQPFDGLDIEALLVAGFVIQTGEADGDEEYYWTIKGYAVISGFYVDHFNQLMSGYGSGFRMSMHPADRSE